MPAAQSWMRPRWSTWLVLAVILGWALATRPYTHLAWDERGRPIDPMTLPYHEILDARARTPIERFVHESNPRLKWPALALAALAMWKVGSIVVPRFLMRGRQTE
ncbi:MAG: hypothetical protein K2Y37_19230 [Pirellulales bacterium]|nr:hypothetical protein [Pirellulales bacterium]